MKLKALFLALAVAGVGASFGLTDTGRSDSGTTTGATTTTTSSTTTTTSTDGCRRFELKGTLASVSASAFTVTVTKGNKATKDVTGTTVSVAVSADTRVSWSGRGTLTGPNTGDSVQAEGKQCGTILTASQVEARGPKKAGSDAAAKTGDSGSSSKGKREDKGGKKK
jgi:hypothetical protein